MVGTAVFSLIAQQPCRDEDRTTDTDTGAAGMSLTKYTPGLPAEGFCCWSLSGVQASVQRSMLHFHKTATTSRRSWNQWAGAGWTLPSLDVGEGIALVYRLRWNNLSGAGELRMHLPSLATISNDEKLVLRFRNGVVDWAICDLRTGRFEHQSRSDVSADGQWCDILINISPRSLRIYENGRNILARARSGTVSGSFDIVCELDELEAFDADLMDFRICPVAVGQDPSALWSTATELQFNTASRDINAQYFSVRQFDSPVKVAYTNSSLQFSTSSLTKCNYTIGTRYTAALPPYCVIQYRFRINTSGGYESKITVAGGLIMRVLHGTPIWQWYYSSSGFSTLSSFSNFRVGGPYVSVLVIVSPGMLTVFENGTFNFEFVRDPPSMDANSWAIFDVQHHDQGTEMDVELSHLRVVSGA